MAVGPPSVGQPIALLQSIGLSAMSTSKATSAVLTSLVRLVADCPADTPGCHLEAASIQRYVFVTLFMREVLVVVWRTESKTSRRSGAHRGGAALVVHGMA